jgi:uncharacterized protein (UPF0332 family)
MSLEELLRNNIIRRIPPDAVLATRTLARTHRDVATAKTLIQNRDFDWALAIAYNAMLSAGRALMFNQGYRPSSTEGHVAVIKYLQVALISESGSKLVTVLNGMRKKRHRIVYEEMDVVSENEAKRSIEWAEELIKKIDEMIQPKK